VEENLKALFRLFTGLPRQGPGTRSATEKAISLLRPLPNEPLILDIGCGTGASTVVLADSFDGNITAIDIHEPYLAELRNSYLSGDYQSSLETRLLSMDALDFPCESFDLIWSEGAVYIMGLASALEQWKPILKHGGQICVSDLCWLRDDPPSELNQFWESEGASPGTTEEYRAIAERLGYDLYAQFTLETEGWWENFYVPLGERIRELRDANTLDPGLAAVLDSTEKEIEIYQRYGDYYGYVFFLLETVSK
jgi:SAM-dependent methyltransferase